MYILYKPFRGKFFPFAIIKYLYAIKWFLQKKCLEYKQNEIKRNSKDFDRCFKNWNNNQYEIKLKSIIL